MSVQAILSYLLFTLNYCRPRARGVRIGRGYDVSFFKNSFFIVTIYNVHGIGNGNPLNP